MPFNGSGTFSIVNTFIPGTTIFSSAVNANFTDIATGLSTCVLKNGTQTITGNIPMAGFGFTGVGKLSSQAVITVASSSTTDILSQSSLLIAISGVATITSLGTGTNTIKFVRATGAFTLTHNATSLILPTGADIIAAVGDTFIAISDASSNVRVYAYQRASGFPVISYPGFRNIARRNGGLEIWQRGAGGSASIAVAASATTGQYTADGWYLLTNANQASVVSQQAGIADGSQWCAKVLRNNGQTGTSAMRFGFPLDTDEIYAVQNQFVRLSFTAKAGANWSPTSGTLTATFIVGTGTPVRFPVGYTGSTTVIGLNVNLTTTATRYGSTSTAVVPSNSLQGEISIVWTPTGTAGADDSFYIDDVQLEVVSSASAGSSPFERLIFEEQWALCKRHFQKSFTYDTAPAQNTGITTSTLRALYCHTAPSSANAILIIWKFPVALRIAPTVTTYNPANTNAQVRDIDIPGDCSATSAATNLTSEWMGITATGNGSSAIGHTLAVHAIADAGI